jgi:dTDP-L-rhamnose 4-epimerase
LLRNSWSVRILDNLSPQVHGHIPGNLGWLAHPGIDFQRGSVTDPVAVDKALNGVDTVVHLAAETGTAQSMYEIDRYNLVNSQATATLLQAIERRPAKEVRRVLLASSRSIYGEGAYRCGSCGVDRVFPRPRTLDQLRAGHWQPACPRCSAPLTAVPTIETDPPATASIYAATKLAQEDLVRIACTSMGIDYCVLRLQNVYGEGQSLQNPYTGIISIFSTRLRRGLQLPLFEDGLCTRDFVHVSDVAEAFNRAAFAERPLNCTLNVGSGSATTIRDVASALAQALGVPPRMEVTGQYRLGDIRHNCADIAALGSALAFTPGVQIVDGMRRFAEWVGQEPLPEDNLDRANRELQARKLMG